MADRVEYSNEVPNYSGGDALLLEVGSREGQVFVRLQKPGAESAACLLEADEAERVVRALRHAVRQVNG